MITVVRSKKTGLPVSTQKAYGQRGDGHVCLVCGVDQIIRPSILGNLYAACRANEEHAQDCPCLELVGSNDFLAIDEFDLLSLAAEILNPPQEGHGGKFGVPGAPHAKTEHVFAPKKLKHLYQLGLCSEADFRINDSVFLHDVLYNPKTARFIDTTCDLGFRAVVATPRWYDRNEKTIYFRTFPEYERRGIFKKFSDIFGLEYFNDEEFESDVNRLFSYGYSRYETVLLFGSWFLLDKYAETKVKERFRNSSRPVRGIQVASCRFPTKQIYVNNTMLSK